MPISGETALLSCRIHTCLRDLSTWVSAWTVSDSGRVAGLPVPRPVAPAPPIAVPILPAVEAKTSVT